ncbi:MAG: VIT domain-containing protein [Bacteroidota bacterium]
MKPVVTTLLLLVAAVTPLWAQNYAQLRVQDPQQWASNVGTIEEATFSIRPKGVYLEYGLFLTFSAQGHGYTQHDTLEVQYYFELPPEAIVTDSWLWVGDDIIQADIRDRWTANNVYEGIVSRRLDPSILYKNSPTQYELRIFPMAGTESRRVKLTYLMPAELSGEQMADVLPTHLLWPSHQPLQQARVLVWPDSDTEPPDPTFVEGPASVAFEQKTDQQFGAFAEARLSTSHIRAQAKPKLRLQSQVAQGVYLGVYPKPGGAQVYQLALLPGQALNATSNRSVAVLLDFDAAKTAVSVNQLIDQTRALLMDELGPGDRFNLMFSQLDVRRASDGWLPADEATIDTAIGWMRGSPPSSYSNLPRLLADATAFIEAQGEGEIVLVTSSDQVGNAETANQLLNDLQARVAALPPIHVVDFADRNLNYYSFGGRTYRANEFFYLNLTRTTNGTYATVRDNMTLREAIEQVFRLDGSAFTSFDLHTSLSSGFSHSRYTVGLASVQRADEPVVQVGQLEGTGDFTVELSGVYEGEVFNQRLTLPMDQAARADATLEAFWAGHKIRALEESNPSNATIAEIIDLSLDTRVLSRYTAFLALEPSLGGTPCDTCRDDTAATTTEQPVGERAVVATAYPNPFRRHTTLTLSLPQPTDPAEITVQVFNVLGQVVRTLTLEGGPSEQFEVLWDGTDNAGQQLGSGTYLIVVTTPTGRHTVKVALIR